MDFVNSIGHSVPEQKVVSLGYPWVRTARLRPTDGPIPRNPAEANLPDRLNYHSHHGPNTHLIVKGDMGIKCTDGEAHHYAGDERFVNPGARYSAKSDTGATFVEGHRCLSPSTAERYIANGKLKAVARPGSRCQLPDEEVLKQWLRNVKFDPNGKARPKTWKREKPICVWAERHHPAQDHLSRWFEKEWAKLQKKQPPIDWAAIGWAAIDWAWVLMVAICLLCLLGILRKKTRLYKEDEPTDDFIL
ncbi:hypothetical protein F5Y18DRAFT_440345 [Xylariaceae sp. FL1019]|nr:hypothetical protein F5Y18DRAFT_440345 [Xylariaceae sp. FL1019]